MSTLVFCWACRIEKDGVYPGLAEGLVYPRSKKKEFGYKNSRGRERASLTIQPTPCFGQRLVEKDTKQYV